MRQNRKSGGATRPIPNTYLGSYTQGPAYQTHAGRETRPGETRPSGRRQPNECQPTHMRRPVGMSSEGFYEGTCYVANEEMMS